MIIDINNDMKTKILIYIPAGTYKVRDIVIEGNCSCIPEFRAIAQHVFVGFTITYGASSSNHIGLYCF